MVTNACDFLVSVMTGCLLNRNRFVDQRDGARVVGLGAAA